MRKNIVFFILILIILTGCKKWDENDYSTAIYYVPHPDDEVLSMGASILHNINLDKEIIVVLLSKGRASKVIHSVNKKLDKHGIPNITLEQFGEARVQEFTKTMEVLGIDEANYYIYDIEDGAFTPEQVIPIIQEFAEKYPGALHNTMSFRDPHKDHASTGKALRKLMKQKEVPYGLYHIPVQRQEKMFYRGIYTVPSHLRENYKSALDVYGIWEPGEGFYHIGQTSVPKYFERAREVMESRWHR